MSEWPIKTVAELVEEGVIERPIDGNHGSIHPKTIDFVPEGIPFVMASDLKSGRIDFSSCSYITEVQAKGLRKGFSKPGDVVLSHKATIGRTAIVQGNDFPFVMLTPQVTYYRVRDPRRLSNRFLKYYFDSREFLQVFETWAGAGSTRAYLGITAQGKLPVRLPPILVQESIVDAVAPFDDKIELNRRMNETLEEMARAIFKDWFVDFGPTRAKAEGREPYLAREIWDLFPDALDEEDKPVGWEYWTLDDLAVHHRATVSPGADPDRTFEHYSLPAYDNGQDPVYDIGESIKSNKTVVPAGDRMSKKKPRVVGVSVTTDPDLPVEEKHGFPEGEQLEILEEDGKFLYSEYDADDNQVGETQEFEVYWKTRFALRKRENEIMGWKPLGECPEFYDIVY